MLALFTFFPMHLVSEAVNGSSGSRNFEDNGSREGEKNTQSNIGRTVSFV